MIHLEVLDSVDTEQIGQFNFGHNIIRIGSAHKNELRIESKGVEPVHLQLRVENSKTKKSDKESAEITELYIESLDCTYKINNITYSGLRLLRAGEVIEINDTKIKIHSFSKTVRNYDFENAYTQRVQDNIYLKELFDRLELEIINLES